MNDFLGYDLADFFTLDSRTSWRNNNGGISKPPITSKMSTTALENVLITVVAKPRTTKPGIKVQEYPFIDDILTLSNLLWLAS